jgi:hypothetical protein
MPYVFQPPAIPAVASADIDQTLPSLPEFNGLTDLKPTIAIDSREQTPLKFTRLKSVPFALFTGPPLRNKMPSAQLRAPRLQASQ